MTDQNDDINFEPFEPGEDYQGEPETATPIAASGNNRNFLIAAGIIGGVFLIGLIVMGVLAASILPQRQAAMRAQQELVEQQNMATAEAATQEAFAYAQAQLPSPTVPPTATLPPPTNTPVVVVDTPTPEPPPAENKAELPEPAVQTEMAATQAAGGQVATLAPGAARTATLAVLLTQVAAGNQTAQPAAGGGVAATSTALPSTGFADEVGLPGLFAAAMGLVVLILLARSLRLTTR